MLYEKLGPELIMSCPALWMRNTADDPTWTAFIYHDHVSWFPGSGYVVEKLFRDYYEENLLASAKGTFKDINNRQQFFNGISSMRPEEWKSGTFEAVATASTDGRRIVIKAVNYEGKKNTLLVRVQGSGAPESADVKVITLKAGLTDAPSMENPDLIRPVTSTAEFNRNLMAFETDPYSVVVIEITEKIIEGEVLLFR